MRIYKRKGSPSWWATWYDQGGKRHRRSLGTDDRKLAEALASQWVQEDFMEEHFGKIPEVPFSDALLNYAKAQKRDHPKHFQTITRYQLRLLQSRFGQFALTEITPAVIRQFMDERRGAVREATAQKSVSRLRAILHRAVEDGILETVPKFPKMRAPKSRNRFLTPEEENRLVMASSPHLVPLIRFAVETGGRLSELLNLAWSSVDMRNGRILFQDTKNGEDRSIRLTMRARAVLASLEPKNIGPVFTYKGKPIKRVQKAFVSARTRAGLNDVRFHDLRHTFASRLVQCGVPLYDVMGLMGHKSITMVQRYAHLAPDYQDKAITALNEFGHNLGTIANWRDSSNHLSA